MDFTDLYSDSTPCEVNSLCFILPEIFLPSLQMMMMLNSYYKMLDDSLSKYSVYKARIKSNKGFLFGLN